MFDFYFLSQMQCKIYAIYNRKYIYSGNAHMMYTYGENSTATSKPLLYKMFTIYLYSIVYYPLCGRENALATIVLTSSIFTGFVRSALALYLPCTVRQILFTFLAHQNYGFYANLMQTDGRLLE